MFCTQLDGLIFSHWFQLALLPLTFSDPAFTDDTTIRGPHGSDSILSGKNFIASHLLWLSVTRARYITSVPTTHYGVEPEMWRQICWHVAGDNNDCLMMSSRFFIASLRFLPVLRYLLQGKLGSASETNCMWRGGSPNVSLPPSNFRSLSPLDVCLHCIVIRPCRYLDSQQMQDCLCLSKICMNTSKK